MATYGRMVMRGPGTTVIGLENNMVKPNKNALN